MARHKDAQWSLPEGKVETWEQASVAVLMDIRDELKTLNALLRCPNFIAIPQKLDAIRRKLPTPPKKSLK